MQFRAFYLFLLLQGTLVAALHRHERRAAETNATLYAYAADTPAWPIAYGVGDGHLYITQDPSTTTTNASLVPLLWDLASITGECWIANATFVNGTSAGSMYFLEDEDYAVGVLPQTRLAYVNDTVTGFALFASQLVYNNNTLLQAQFWAKATDVESVYALVWVTDDASPDAEFPVVVKAEEDS
ncbi:hypothetical protein BJY00DRAFT_311100 [Aspergillus carlsbadensis]|nr:hypothetical protein BJY00DRAFT_311100 [Aspergillus carlsbadensis]